MDMDTPGNLLEKEVISKSPSDTSSKRYRLLELYSGIGGMRFALEAAGICFEVVAAADMNPVVNDVYIHNFGLKGHYQRNISSFTTIDVKNMHVDIITMSPPCQPFTRVGLKKDIEDARSNSFLHILNVLTELEEKPMYIILENVQGFERSQARDILIQTLNQCNYKYREFLLSPQDFGIPNSRLRYYLIAKYESQSHALKPSQIFYKVPDVDYHWRSHCTKCIENSNTDDADTCPLKHFIEDETSQYFDSYLVPDHILLKYWTVFDIVNENSQTSCCFTKAYSHYAQGTGSIFIPINDASKATNIFQHISNSSDSDTQLKLLKNIRLRYFTPKEIANIMCFPDSFEFPPHVTLRQKYRSLGNSLNVFVVSCLMQSLFHGNIFSWINLKIFLNHMNLLTCNIKKEKKYSKVEIPH